MDDDAHRAPAPIEAPIASGTPVVLDEGATLLERSFITGGAPWRLLRLSSASHAVAQRWRDGGHVGVGEERLARTFVDQGLLHPRGTGLLDPDDVDVVIPVHDDEAALRTLLTGLDDLHVTIVDDASSRPRDVETIARGAGAQFVRLEHNVGPGAARNAGAGATSRPFLWFLDADLVLDNATDVLARLASSMSDPLVGACAPRIRGGAGTGARSRFERSVSPLDMGERTALVVPLSAVSYVPSACLLVRRDAFAAGFDETLRIGEDVDFVWGLHDRGWLVRYHAPVVVTHPARTTWPAWWRQRVGYGTSAAALARRHPTRMAPLRVDRWTLAAWTAVLAGRPAIALRIGRAARTQVSQRVATHAERPRDVANAVLMRTMVRSGAPLARALVRTFSAAVLLTALHPRLRRRMLVIWVVGTFARWRSARVHPSDVVLGAGDDLAYGLGVVGGAWRERSLTALTPRIGPSTMTWRDVLRPSLKTN